MFDACCGVGGAARGYQRAGWHVTGMDIVPQPRYAGDEFLQGDAITYIREHGHEYEFIHASPPCQASSALTRGTNKGREYPQLIPAVRAALQAAGRPYVIENVPMAPVRKDLVLCGEMFGLGVLRHRWFEFGGEVWCLAPPHIEHRGRVAGYRHGVWHDGPYLAVYGKGGGKGSVAQWQTAMGIDWTGVRKEIADAIPPAYTEWIGRAVLAQITPDQQEEVAQRWP
ncbi:DNA cytosine methyltransferase [Sphaerisporangium sp. NPDC004334]